MGTHYVLLAVPWVLLGACAALVRLLESGKAESALRWWRGACALCAVFLIAFDPMHPMHYLRAAQYQHTASVEHAMSCVPRDARIATHDEWLAHYALAYPGITQFGKHPGRFAGYVVFAQDWQNSDFEGRVLPQLRAARAQGLFRLRCRYGDVVVLERR
jgi:hypothetical protein